jgi:hypothetical protein
MWHSYNVSNSIGLIIADIGADFSFFLPRAKTNSLPLSPSLFPLSLPLPPLTLPFRYPFMASVGEPKNFFGYYSLQIVLI